MKGILDYTEEPLVSIDFKKSTYSSIVDGPFIKVLSDNMVKMLIWYDNEWGYSNRVVQMVDFVGKKLKAKG